MDDKKLRRAGLDYGEWKDVKLHKSWQHFIEEEKPENMFAVSTKGSKYHHEAQFTTGHYLILGPETRGLPSSILDSMASDNIIRIPMRANSRSMNLSNATAVIVYEAWRQLDFEGASLPRP